MQVCVGTDEQMAPVSVQKHFGNYNDLKIMIMVTMWGVDTSRWLCVCVCGWEELGGQVWGIQGNSPILRMGKQVYRGDPSKVTRLPVR